MKNIRIITPRKRIKSMLKICGYDGCKKRGIHKMEISATDKNGRTKTAKAWLCNNHVGYALKCSMKDEE